METPTSEMVETAMNVTVIICTWNRCDLLQRALESIVALDIPTGLAWEVLVIDNNSPDGTQAVVERYAKRLPLRCVIEPTLGIAHARTRAIREASGELTVWLDDDEFVEPDWLTAYWEAWHRWPEAGFFVGHIEGLFEREPSAALAEAFGCVRRGFCNENLYEDERPIEPRSRVGSGNMALPREVVKQRRFPADLGRRGDERIAGEETAFFTALEDDGYRGVWVPSARLKHWVPKERVLPSYVKKLFRGLGRTYVRRGDLADGPRLAGIPRWVLRRYLQQFLMRYLGAPFRSTSQQYRLCGDLWRLEGTIAECWDRRNRS